MRKVIKSASVAVNKVRGLKIGDKVTGMFDGDGNEYTADITNIHISYGLSGDVSAYLEYNMTNLTTGSSFQEKNSAEAFYKTYISKEW